MNASPRENKEWLFLGGTAVGAIVALASGPHTLFVAAAGTLLGLVFAPKSGRETRVEIGAWARRLYSQFQDFADPSALWVSEEAVPDASDPGVKV